MIYRINKTKDFSVMSNYHLKDKELSLKAKGLLSVMLSLPDEWDFSMSGLEAMLKESKGSLRGVLSELEELGYLVRTREHGEGGKFSYIYNVYETPCAISPCMEKPHTVKPHTVEPHTENDTQLNTNILNTKELNTKELNTYININVEFEELWQKYPKKQGKKEAFNHYKATRKKASFEDIEKGLNNYLMYIKSNNIEQRYIKNGSTWFNGHYEDEYETPRETSYDSEAVRQKAQQEIIYKRKGE